MNNMINTASHIKTWPVPNPDEMALFIDFDGTLVELGPTPDAISVLPSMVAFLARLQKKLGNAFAIISGRPISDLDRFLHPLAFAASGCHGAEIRLQPEGPVYARGEPLPQDIVDRARSLAGLFPGIIFEDKIYGLCLHFGSSDIPRQIFKKELSDIIAERKDYLNVIFDASGCEIKQRLIDKGTAVQELLSHPPFKGRVPLYVGDDLADCEVFPAIKDAGGFIVQVGGKDMFSGANLVLPSVTAVYAWLEEISAGRSYFNKPKPSLQRPGRE